MTLLYWCVMLNVGKMILPNALFKAFKWWTKLKCNYTTVQIKFVLVTSNMQPVIGLNLFDPFLIFLTFTIAFGMGPENNYYSNVFYLFWLSVRTLWDLFVLFLLDVTYQALESWNICLFVYMLRSNSSFTAAGALKCWHNILRLHFRSFYRCTI